MGSVAHGDKPAVWFATAYQTSYDRHAGCWTAGLEVRTETEADARAMCERMLGACDESKYVGPAMRSMYERGLDKCQAALCELARTVEEYEFIIDGLCDDRVAMRGLCRRLDADVQMWRARAYEGAE